MNFSRRAVSFLFLISGSLSGLSYNAPEFPFSPAAGEPGSTAVSVDDPGITDWATSVKSVTYGPGVAEEWRSTANALGPGGTSQSHLVVLGRGGDIVLEFNSGITDGPGDDFVVFENAFRNTFLELAYVDVSTDGEHFVRFPSYSLTANPVSAFGDVYPTFVHGLAGKYGYGFGTPFDLQILQQAFSAAERGEGGFSESYKTHLLENAPMVDLSSIRFVRIVDVLGDGSQFDSEGFPVYDPYPTSITAGFDLDAVGVINTAGPGKVSFSDWCATNGIPAEWGTDSDGDKWSNAMEYLLGSDPSAGESKPIMKKQILAESDELLILFDLNPLAVKLPVAEISADGENWETVPIRQKSDLLETSDGSLEGNWGIRMGIGEQGKQLFRLSSVR